VRIDRVLRLISTSRQNLRHPLWIEVDAGLHLARPQEDSDGIRDSWQQG
jgi:hypothetical protein